MPGLAGILSLNPSALQARDTMLRALVLGRHASTGSNHSDPARGVHVGWAAAPGAAWSGRIGWSEDRSICLVHCGEISVDAAASDSKDARPAPGPADVEYLIRAYERLGEKVFELFNGSFSGVLIDARRNRTHLFNDRYGLGRLYLYRRGKDIYFSTDVDSILEVNPSARAFDARSVAEFFTIGCPLSYRTLYADVHQLPAASICTYLPDGQWRVEKYFDPASWEQQEKLSPEAYQRELTDTFSALLPEYLGPPGSSAMSLTGGLDGRMIMAWARAEPGKLPCYSFASSYRDCEDVRIARRVASASAQPLRTFVVGKEFLESFPGLAAEAVRISGGAMDVTGASELYVNKLAREVSNVRVTGNYGSEILRGGVAFRPRKMAEHLCSESLRSGLRLAERTYADERSVADLTFIAFKQVPWHHHSRLSVERSQLTVRSPFLDDRIVRLTYRAPAGIVSSKTSCLQLIYDGSPKLAGIPTDRGLSYNPPNAMDRLKHSWLEFTFKAEYAYDYGMPQWLTKFDALVSVLRPERLFLGRHKFQHYRIWYRRELASFVRDVLHSPSSQLLEFFDRRSLQQMSDDHINGKANYTVEIHRALTLEMVVRHLLQAR